MREALWKDDTGKKNHKHNVSQVLTLLHLEEVIEKNN